MSENTSYNIVTNREATHPLHFSAHSFLHALSYTFVLYPHCTPVNSCYTSSTPILIMTSCLRYTAGHSMTPALHICALPVVYGMHPPVVSTCIPVGIEIHHYCSPSPIRLAIHMCRRAHKHNHNVYGHLIKRTCNTLTNEQDWAWPGQPEVNGGGRACVTL